MGNIEMHHLLKHSDTSDSTDKHNSPSFYARERENENGSRSLLINKLHPVDEGVGAFRLET